MFEDARSEFGAASLRSELDLPRVESLQSAAGLPSRSELDSPAVPTASLSGAVEAVPAQAPPRSEAACAGATPLTASPVLATASQGTAPEAGLPAVGGDAALMTPRTRARMDPMGDIVRMIETGSARKGPRPPNIPSGARAAPTIAALATNETSASAEGTNLGAAFDMEAGSKLPAAQQPQLAAAGPMDETTQRPGAGRADDVIEPQQQLTAPSPEVVRAGDQATGLGQELPDGPSQSTAASGPVGTEEPSATGGLVTGVATAVGVAAGAVAGVAVAAASAVSALVGSEPADSSQNAEPKDESLDPEVEQKSPAAPRLPLMARLGSAPSLPGGSDAMSGATDPSEAQAAVPSSTQRPPTQVATAGVTEYAAAPSSVQAAAIEAIKQPAGAEFLPPAAAGMPADVTEPPSAVAGAAEEATEPQQAAPAHAESLAAITEPAGAEFLPPAAAGQADDVIEPQQQLAPAGADTADEITQPAGLGSIPPGVAGPTGDVLGSHQLPPESAGTDGTYHQPADTREDLPGDSSQAAAASDAAGTAPTVAGGLAAGIATAAGAAAGAAAGVAGVAASAVSQLVNPEPAAPREAAPSSAGLQPGPEEVPREAAETEPASSDATTAPSTSATAIRAVSFAPLPVTEAAGGVPVPEGSGEGRPATQQSLPADKDAVEAKDELAAAGLPPGPPPIATPPPQESGPSASPPPAVFSPTDSQTESLASGADVADAELLMLQRAKTREGDAAGTATELPMAAPPLPAVSAAFSPVVASPAAAAAVPDDELPPSKTATARAALLGTGLTDDALPGAVTVGGVAAAIGAANASVGGKSAQAAPEEGELGLWRVVVCSMTVRRTPVSTSHSRSWYMLMSCLSHVKPASHDTCSLRSVPAGFPQGTALLTSPRALISATAHGRMRRSRRTGGKA